MKEQRVSELKMWRVDINQPGELQPRLRAGLTNTGSIPNQANPL